MAVPSVGKWIVLLALLFIFYVSYGFKIRDVGHAGSVEQHDACVDVNECPDGDAVNHQVTSSSSRKIRLEADGVGSFGRVKFSTGRKIDGNREIRSDDIKRFSQVEYEKGRLKVESDEEENDDDDDDDVVIEDDEDFERDYSEDEEKNDDDDDDARRNSEEKSELKWSFKKIKREEDDEDSEEDIDHEENSIFRRNDVKKISNKIFEHDERTKHDRVKGEVEVENNSDDEEAHESTAYEKNDDMKDDSVVKLETAKKIEKKEEITATERNALPLRKLEKVRLADKEKVKLIEEVTVVKNVKEKPQKIERKGKATMDIEESEAEEKVTPKNDLLVSSKEEIKDKEKKKQSETVEKKKKKVVKIENQGVHDPGKESTIKSEEKKKMKREENKAMDGKEKIKKQSETKRNEKSKDDSKGTQGKKKKGKSIASRKQSETLISLTRLNDEILRLPNFVPNFTAVVNPVCQQHGKIFLRQLRGHKLWAFQMLDSSAKIPSGLLQGNINQLGDYDECLGILAHVKIDDKTVRIQGKYCLANIDIFPSSPDMKVPASLMQSRNLVRSSLKDTGHFVPKFTTVSWALCLPAACSSSDARDAISNALGYVNMTSGLKFIVDVNPEMCYTRQRTHNYSKETIGVLYFYAMILCLVFIATVRDFLIDPKAEDDISCIHGIRSITTIMLYLAHKMIPLSASPYPNRINLSEVFNNPISSVLRASIVYTDSFFFISGVLSAFNMAKEFKARGEIRWFCRFVARFIRLTPALLVVIFWYAYVMEHTGSGPQWNIMKENAELCKKNSWTNLFYIQNFFPFEEMCATHTHQLALDMQLSLLAPILVFFLEVKPTIGILLIFFLLQLSATLRYFATTNNYLSVVIFHGISVKQLYKTANLTYALSIHRLTPYLFGVGLGVLMHRTGKSVKMYKIFVVVGWILAIMLGGWSIFSTWPMAKRDYVYDLESTAYYTVIGPVSWALALSWVIFACFTDHAGMMNRFLSSYWLVVFSRISYSVYLTQFPIFFYNIATTRYASEFQVHRAIDFYEVLTVIIISTILTLFFDIPMQEVKSVLLESTDTNTIKLEGNETNQGDHEKTSKTPVKEETSRWFEKNRKSKQEIENSYNIHNEEPDTQSWRWTKDEFTGGHRERKRSKSSQRNYKDLDVGFQREVTPSRYQDEFYRGRRSLSRTKDVNFKPLNDRENIYETKRERSEEIGRERSGQLSRRVPVTLTSFGSDDDLLLRRGKSPRRPVERPRVSDEEDWEQELRIRRRRFMERMALEEQNMRREKEETPESVTRSSAEGKIALLTEVGECRGMDAWTVSRGPKISIIGGSSQEVSENEDDSLLAGDYELSEEEQQTSSMSNIVEEAEKSKILIDVQQSSQEEQAGDTPGFLSTNEVTPVATGKLFKRASIVKSQASEEDPEYLLPERPKLVEQEQEHPFKKAWQMQKSRSEEDGPSAFAIRDVKTQQPEGNQTEKKSSSPPPPPESSSTCASAPSQSFQLVVEDVDLEIGQTKQNDVENNARLMNDREKILQDFDEQKNHSDKSGISRPHWTREDENIPERDIQRRSSESSKKNEDDT